MGLKLRRLIALIVLCVMFKSVISQQRRDERRGPRPRPRVRQRGRQPPPEPVVERINCYFCYIDFRLNKFDVNNLCFNPAYNFTSADAEYLTACPKKTQFCVVDITRIGGGLAVVDRKCGGSTCNYFCINKGYGVEIETCTNCCPGKPVISDDELEGEVKPKYQCP